MKVGSSCCMHGDKMGGCYKFETKLEVWQSGGSFGSYYSDVCYSYFCAVLKVDVLGIAVKCSLVWYVRS